MNEIDKPNSNIDNSENTLSTDDVDRVIRKSNQTYDVISHFKDKSNKNIIELITELILDDLL